MDTKRISELVAEKVMGYEDVYTSPYGIMRGHKPPQQAGMTNKVYTIVPGFAKDIAAAWLVVEKLNEYHGLEFTYNRVCEEGNPRWVQFEWCGAGNRRKYTAVADTVALAICLAALAALGVEVPHE